MIEQHLVVEKIVFLDTESWKKTNKLFPNFRQSSHCHLQGNVRGLMSLIVWPRGATLEELQGDGWNPHALVSVKGGLPFVDLDGLLYLSPVVVVLPSYYSNLSILILSLSCVLQWLMLTALSSWFGNNLFVFFQDSVCRKTIFSIMNPESNNLFSRALSWFVRQPKLN